MEDRERDVCAIIITGVCVSVFGMCYNRDLWARFLKLVRFKEFTKRFCGLHLAIFVEPVRTFGPVGFMKTLDVIVSCYCKKFYSSLNARRFFLFGPVFNNTFV